MRFKIYSKDKYWDEVEKEAEAKTTTFHERAKASVATKKARAEMQKKIHAAHNGLFSREFKTRKAAEEAWSKLSKEMKETTEILEIESFSRFM